MRVLLFAAAGVPLLPALPKIAAQVMAAQYQAISTAAQGCDVMVATGLFSSVFAAYCPMFLPSPYQRPFEYPSHPLPAGVIDNQVLWDKDVPITCATTATPIGRGSSPP